MNIERLEEGMVIKNYKELCNVLEIEECAGNSRKAQLKELERFVEYHKDGHKYIIDTVYDIPKDKVDGRSGNMNASSKYNLPLEKKLLEILKESKYNQICLPKYVLCEELGLVGFNYRYFNYKYSNLASILDVRNFEVKDFYNCTNSNLTYALTSLLERLSKRRVLMYQKVLVGKSSEDYCYHEITNKKILKRILTIQNQAIKSVECEDISEVIYKNKYKNYNNIVNKQISKEFNLMYIFDAYKVTSTKDILNDELSKYKDIKTNEINKDFLDKSISSISDRHEVAIDSELQPDKIQRNSKIMYRRLPDYIYNSTKVAIATIDIKSSKLCSENEG